MGSSSRSWVRPALAAIVTALLGCKSTGVAGDNFESAAPATEGTGLDTDATTPTDTAAAGSATGGFHWDRPCGTEYDLQSDRAACDNEAGATHIPAEALPWTKRARVFR